MTRRRRSWLMTCAVLVLVASAAGAFITHGRSATKPHQARATPRGSYHEPGPPKARPVVSRWETGLLEVVFFDVGQGDGIGLRCPDGRMRIVDAGTSSTPISDYLTANHIPVIESLLMTHPHQDHIGGALALIRSFPVHRIYDAGVPHTTMTYREILTEAEARSISYFQPRAGDTLDWGAALRVEVFHPDTVPYENMNDNSIVLRITFGKMRLLLTGDAQGIAEDHMVSRFGRTVGANDDSPLQADILKVGHHGSHSSTHEPFITLVHPKVAIISCGAGNTYGHPHSETLDTLNRHGVTIFRTDLQGSIILSADKDTWQIRTSR